MKFVSIVVIGMVVLAGQVYGADESALKSEKDKLSYTFGANFGKSLKQTWAATPRWGKGMALAGRKPMIGVSSLQSLAWPVAAPGGLVCAILDAGKGEVYSASYRFPDGLSGGDAALHRRRVPHLPLAHPGRRGRGERPALGGNA